MNFIVFSSRFHLHTHIPGGLHTGPMEVSIKWPARSPDQWSYFFAGFQQNKSLVSETKHQNLSELKIVPIFVAVVKLMPITTVEHYSFIL